MDANFNRAREALRVMEEFARFILDDTDLSTQAKTLRHDLATIINQLPVEYLLASRDTAGDVGTTISTPNEKDRSDTVAVVNAAAKRLSEALRCLEEYSKVESATLASGFESLRYRAYQFEKHIMARAVVTEKLAAVGLYVLVTRQYCRNDILDTTAEAIEGGADCIQLREKALGDAELLDLAAAIAKICHDRGALFIMNDRPDLAILSHADGVHVGQGDLSVEQARRIIEPHMIVGKSTHNLDEFSTAHSENPDYLAVGSIFPSLTKPGVDVAGTALLEKICPTISKPIIAIGGITPENAGKAINAGASGVAVCQAVIGAADVAQAARNIKEKIIKTQK